MSKNKDFEDDDQFLSDDEVGDDAIEIFESKRAHGQHRTDIRRLIEQREEAKLLREELGLFYDHDRESGTRIR